MEKRITPLEIREAIQRVRDHSTLINHLLAETLQWPIEDRVQEIADISFGWTSSELRAEGLEDYLVDGRAWQIQPLRDPQPWGIFVLEFHDERVYRTALRQVLRGLVPKRRRDASLPAWRHDNLLFICTTRDYDQITFAHFRGEKAQTARLATFGWQRGDPHVRTVCEFSLPALEWPDDDVEPAEWIEKWSAAFDKERLTKDFFRRFDDAVAAVQADLERQQGMKPSEAYSAAQLLLERLIFLYFLQNRGWLNQEREYLLRNFEPHRDRPKEFSYYGEFLEPLFWSLATPPRGPGRLQGIPFLNGGLFDDDEFTPLSVARMKHKPPLKVQNSTFKYVFDELLEAFNFTVREDTPLDQDVAVDPEMLGKVFESIVLHAEAADPDAVAPDKRKATGSYYTPRIVVHFICREVLYQYLRRHLPGDNWDQRLKDLLEMNAAQGLSPDQVQRLRTILSPQEGAQIRDIVRNLKCCDPAVGSGAFPVGLMHELLNLRRVVETAANGYVDPVRKHGTGWLHTAKEEIVQDSLFGVDIQQQAIEICQLRLWLSLVVDYDLGLDPFTAERSQFLDAISRLSQLPNLEMNFRRGDSLLDLISDIPVRIEPGAIGHLREHVAPIQKLSEQLHHATKSTRKKELRVEILRRRLDLTERVLKTQLEKLENQDAHAASVLFGEELADREKRRRLAGEIEQAKKSLKKIEADRKQLDKLAARPLDTDFYAKLRRLEGADFDSPFNFVWRLDFPAIFAREQPGFDIIVGNPPFVTARNSKKREMYRERWSRVCTNKYHMLCPFLELSFNLLRDAGQLGFIVSNAFAKREFGKPLVEVFFPTVNLQKLIDCSGLLFPGHGTPTCLIFGSDEAPNSDAPIRVAGILPGGGDLRTPPEDSLLWHALAEHHWASSYSDSRVVVADRSRAEMAMWPWNFDVGAVPTKQQIDAATPHRLSGLLGGSVGFDAISAANDIYYLPGDCMRRLGLPIEFAKHLLVGEMLRNYEPEKTSYTLWPYAGKDSSAKLNPTVRSYLTPFREYLEVRSQFRKTQLEAGLEWFEFREYHRRALRQQLTYADIATHLHVVYSEGNRVFNQHAPVIELPRGAGLDQHHVLAGLLNSSAALFWLKQICFNKGAGEDEERDRFEFAGGKIEQLPVPKALALHMSRQSSALSLALTQVSCECWKRGDEQTTLTMRALFTNPDEAYHDWNSSLPAHVLPGPAVGKPFKTTDDLRAAVQRMSERREKLRSEMIARQEEMDWLVYAAYGLIDEPGPALPEAELVLAREERPFCLWAQADGDFARARALIPAGWSSARSALWTRRLELIRDNEHVRRIEQPVYKRRWDEQWKIGSGWHCGQSAYDAEFLDAFHWWLSEKAEWWLEHSNRGRPVSLTDWTTALWSDPHIRAAWPVAAETAERLERWKQQQSGKKHLTPATVERAGTGFAANFKTRVKDQCVPEDIPFAVPWDELEKKRKIPASVKSIRGKLNVPRERFWVTADGQYRQASPL